MQFKEAQSLLKTSKYGALVGKGFDLQSLAFNDEFYIIVPTFIPGAKVLDVFKKSDIKETVSFVNVSLNGIDFYLIGNYKDIDEKFLNPSWDKSNLKTCEPFNKVLNMFSRRQENTILSLWKNEDDFAFTFAKYADWARKNHNRKLLTRNDYLAFNKNYKHHMEEINELLGR